MQPPPHVEVAAVTPALARRVRQLRLAPGQDAYVGDIGFQLDDALANPRSAAMAVLANAAVVGFYRLDQGATIAMRTPLPHCVGVRAFVIDAGHQGGGLGSRAMRACCADAVVRFPDCRLLVLNVHCRNTAAIRAYRAAGFVETGELQPGGRAGPQHVMLRSLD